jgi:hypothetical protein
MNDPWISARRARGILRLSHTALLRLAVIGEVATLLRPGLTPRYSRADCERLAASRAPQAAGS